MQDKKVQIAKEELSSLGSLPPASLDDVIAGIQGFGIEEFEEIISLEAGGKVIRLRLSNICPDDEMTSLMAVEGNKGYAWVMRVKAEVLSRAICWISIQEKGATDGPGIDLRSLPKDKRFVRDPKDGVEKDIQAALRNAITGWGEELVGLLWKVFMVHAQRVEDRLRESLPDTSIMTEVEKRFLESAMKEIDDQAKEQIRATVAEIFKNEEPEEVTEEKEKVKLEE